jgi:hypothetical protein
MSSTFGLSLVPTSSMTGRLLVMIVSGRPSSRTRWATKYAVDEESRKTLWRGASVATAARASARLASGAVSTRAMNESSWAEIAGSTAPPCVRRARPWRSRSARSRRAVIDEMPKRSSSPPTVTEPVLRSRSTIAARRDSASTGRSGVALCSI